VADRREVDIISSGRDPDRRRPAGWPWPAGWRWLAATIAAALVASGVAAHLILGSSGHLPHRKAHGALSSVTLAAPSMLHGTPLRPGGAPAALLFLGGNQLRLLNVAGQATARVASAPPAAGGARDPLGPDPVVRQIISVTGGIVAVLAGDGSAGLPDIGDVVFIPVRGSRAGAARLIARANYAAVAPDHSDIWVEQAGPPWGNGPADSPVALVDEAGHRLSAAAPLHGRVLDAATAGGLLVQGPLGEVALINPVSGTAVRSGIPANAIIAGADADQVAWVSASCTIGCSLHVTSVPGGQDKRIALPPATSVDLADASAFDQGGQRLALPLDIANRRGMTMGTSVYVADISAGTLIPLPGGPVPLAALPAVPGAIPAGTSDVVSVRWTADGSRLWIVATDGLFFQAAYWTGAGPLRVLRPQPGLAYKFGLPGPGAPGQ
jgi:hypothetical protein